MSESVFASPTMSRATETMSARAFFEKYHQCGRLSTWSSSPAFSSFLGRAMTRRVGPSSVHAASVDPISRTDAVEEQQAVEVIELVLDGPRLEGVDLENDLGAIEADAPDDEVG